MSETKKIEKVNIFITVYESILKVEKYRVYIRQPVGKAITYLILLSILFGIINMTPFIWGLNKKINDISIQIQTNLPDFIIKDGFLTTETQKTVSTQVDDVFNIILDPTNTYDLKQLNKAPSIYANKSAISVRLYPYVFNFTYREMAIESATKLDLINYVASLKRSSPIIMVLGIIFFILMKLVNALILGLFAMFMGRSDEEDMNFPRSFKLATYALTLPIVLEAFAAVLGISDSFSTIYHIVSMVFVFYVINKLKQQEFV
jgi:hypothetical protein